MAGIKYDFSQVDKLLDSFKFQDESFEVDIPVAYAPFAFGVGFEVKDIPANINFARLADGCENAIARAIAEQLPQYLDRSIEDLGVVDTGELKRSLSIGITPSGVEIRYGAPYAAIQHEGGYIQPYGNPNAQKAFIPGRPWVDQALQRMPLREIARQACASYLRSQGL